MEIGERDIEVYVRPDGRAPFEEWFSGLRDKTIKARILTRLDRLRSGNPGDVRGVGAGVYELRMSFGSGYRVYFGVVGQRVVLLLCGGDKGSQSRDIATAHAYWQEYESHEQ